MPWLVEVPPAATGPEHPQDAGQALLIGVVQVALQPRRLKIAAGLPDTQILMAELQNFRVKINLAGHDSYGAGAGEAWRENPHDVLVLGVACALWAAQRSRGATLQAI